MRRIFQMVAFVMATTMMGTSFVACSSSDDGVPAPTVSSTTSNGTVNLMKTTVFSLPVSIRSEAGVASVKVMDQNGNVWADQRYADYPNSLDKVDIDLSKLETSTLLQLKTIVTDREGQQTSSASTFVLNVYAPEIYCVAEDVSTLTDNAVLNVMVSRGLKPLEKMEVECNGQTQTIDLTSSANEEKVSESFTLSDLKDGENNATVNVYVQGNAAPALVKTVKVVKMDNSNIMKYVVKVDGVEYIFDYHMMVIFNPEEGTMTTDEKTAFVQFLKAGTNDGSVESVETLWELKYNDKHLVEQLTQNTQVGNTVGKVDAVYKFNYNTLGELQGVTKDGKDYVTNVQYEEGVMTSYDLEGKTVTPQYSNGVRVDCLSADGLMFNYTGNEEANPFYVIGLPAVIPGFVNNLPVQMGYSKYLFNGLNGANWTNGTYVERVIVGMNYETYEYIYDDVEHSAKTCSTTINGKKYEFFIVYRK